MMDIKATRWMTRAMVMIITVSCPIFTSHAQDRRYSQIDESGNITQRSENRNFNKHNNDTTKNKEIPKGHYVWTVDRKFGDVIPSTPDTLHHLYMNTLFNTGMYGDFNTTGNNYTARLSRIFINRKETSPFMFTDPYSFFFKQPDEFLFMNTLSPYTVITYENCGDKQFGEDYLDAKFTINANKRLGMGFDLNYNYAPGYYNHQSTSHFDASFFATYIGDRYQMHALFSIRHQKASENGGITNDDHITHPESFTDTYDENEIPTVLQQNWNRNDNQHLFLSHRYNVGFYRKVPMTEEELKARKFAEESKKEKESEKDKDKKPKGRDTKNTVPKGRPEGAAIMGSEPANADSLAIMASDTTRIKVDGQATIDSLARAQAIQDSIDATMKKEYVPVTSFIHTLEVHNYKRTYQAYATPAGYYLDRYYTKGLFLGHDSIYDTTKLTQVKNTLAIALLEGFNKYVKAGLKGFVTHELRNYRMPDIVENMDSCYERTWKENAVSVGGQLNKTQGKTLHFNAMAETWLIGEDAGQLKLDFSTDLNFALFGDTVRLAAKAYYHSLHPTFYQRHYQSKHLWWNNSDLSNEKRTRLEGLFSYQKTDTKLRVALENISNYTYFGMKYDASSNGKTNMTAGVYQESDNISVITAQLHQNLRLGPLNWENVVTYQKSSNNDVLPLPTLNLFTNLYFQFRIARVLDVEIGADATWFSEYYAPDFCPAINQFAIQKNESSRVELGGYPFVDAYANMKLKGVRFFVVMTNLVNGGANHMKFLAPHYPTNGSVLHFGVSWPFFN